MIRSCWLCVLLPLALLVPSAPAQSRKERKNFHLLDEVNQRICGQVLDFTHNHGADNRIWSNALCQYRDLYVYLPPGFDPGKRYPLVIYFHGFTQDEQSFLEDVAEPFDRAICCGKLQPVIIAVPDGSLQGKPTFLNSASFFANTPAGRFEDFVIEDVWDFMINSFSICPEPEAHALIGISMGGAAAFNLAMKYQDRFKVVMGYMPALNLRWVDCHERFKGKFDPDCWGWRTKLRPHEEIGRFYGVVSVKFKHLSKPLFGRGPDVLDGISEINPIEVMERVDLQPGQLAMYIAYAGRDQFNCDAQVDSFLAMARCRGIDIPTAFDPQGKHDAATGLRLFDGGVDFLRENLGTCDPSPTPARTLPSKP